MKRNSCFCPATWPAQRPARRRAALRLLFLPLLPLLLLGACQQPAEVPMPAELLPREQMVGLLVELHTLEARTDGASSSSDSTLALFRQEQKKIYWRYEVTDSAFTQSYRYYATHNQDLSEIYTAVVDSLAILEAQKR